MSTDISLLVAAAMLAGNAFFVGAEFALVSARRSNIELEALNGSRAAKATLNAMEQVSVMLAGAQLGVTLCSLVFGAVAEPLAAQLLSQPFHNLGIPPVLLEPAAFAGALALMVYLHVVLGEMVPKNLSLTAATRAALLLVPPLLLIVRLVKPLVVILNAVANSSVRLLGIKPRQEIRSSFSRDEVAGFVKESHREGLLSEEEEQLLSGSLSFEERSVRSVILPLDKLVITSYKPSTEEVERLTAQTGFSRFPVPDKQGTLRGYVHIKDMLLMGEDEHRQSLPSRYIRPLAHVKTTMSLRDALAAMQLAGAHLADVTNTRGAIVGVVMLEDVLEELVGVIRDETQKQSAAA